MAIKISPLSITDWTAYKALRLKALEESPLAFLDSFEEALNKVDDHWIRHLQADKHSSITLFARENKNLVGMCAILFNSKNKHKHVAEIGGNYVDKAYRGKGIGGLLMQEIINAAVNQSGIKKINLQVVVSQKPAIKLYQKFGFRKVGKLTGEFLCEGKYYDILIMEKLL